MGISPEGPSDLPEFVPIGPVQLQAANPENSPDALKLSYAQPADELADALTIGNGQFGAVIYGGVAEEHLQFNEDTLWSGGPRSYDNPDAYGHLANVRELLEQGEYAQGEATAE